MGKIKVFPTPEYSSKQSSDPVMPLIPCTGIFLGPSKSGKTVALISLILEQYRGVFEKIYIFSPSVNIDDGWIPVKKYIEQDLGVNTEKEQAAALRGIIQRQRKITETSKKLEMKKLYQVLIILDDLADMPQLHKANGALDTLFIRGRLISAAVRVNQQFLCCWRLRNQHELEAVIGAPCCRRTSCTGSTSRRPGTPTASSSYTTSGQSLWKKKPMGAALSFLGQKLFASSTFFSSFAFAVIAAAPTPCRSRLAELKRVRP